MASIQILPGGPTKKDPSFITFFISKESLREILGNRINKDYVFRNNMFSKNNLKDDGSTEDKHGDTRKEVENMYTGRVGLRVVCLPGGRGVGLIKKTT